MFEFTSVSNASVTPTEPLLSDEPVIPTQSDPSGDEEQFLRFSLEPETEALLPLQHLVEVLNILGKEIVPIFSMPAWVTGVYNLRGEILWIVDLGHLLGLTPCYQQGFTSSSYTTIVLNVTSGAATQGATPTKARNQMLGCIINHLEAIEQCDINQIQPPQLTSAIRSVSPFLQGYWLKSDNEMLAVLDFEAIIAALPKPKI
jgi:positive phototaxis protein PixI